MPALKFTCLRIATAFLLLSGMGMFLSSNSWANEEQGSAKDLFLEGEADAIERVKPDVKKIDDQPAEKEAEFSIPKSDCKDSNTTGNCLIPESSGIQPTLGNPPQKVEVKPLNIIDLQAFKDTQTIKFMAGGDAEGEVELINLNTNINVWYVLRILWPHKQKEEWFHLQNIHPKNQKLYLEKGYANGIVIENGDEKYQCNLWSLDGAEIKLAKFRKQPFSSLCKDKIYLRNKIEGYRTTKEWVVEFLRDNIWGGETITDIVKSTIYKDRYLVDSEVKKEDAETQIVKQREDFPISAEIKAEDEGYIEIGELGIDFNGAEKGELQIGKWYKSKKQNGAFVSVIKPNVIKQEILESHEKYVKKLEAIEAKAASYLIAFDLSQYEMHFSIGTEHPRVGWSARVREADRDVTLVGPDGISSIEPLSGTGLIPPHIAKSVAAAFTAGFKRSHGAFKWGKLAKVNHGSHYGFIENGVVFSKLQPNLATILVYSDGQIDMKTWQEKDNELLPFIRYARQNGVPVIEYDEESKIGIPGDYVSNWTLGNWSGSQDRAFRTLRAGMCLASNGNRKFLIYGYFSSVTPTAMARIFQAYNCSYAMHLDMNALEHTYLAIYSTDKSGDPRPEQLIEGMKVLDQRFKGNVPRFIGYPDNRDFFFLTRGAAD